MNRLPIHPLFLKHNLSNLVIRTFQANVPSTQGVGINAINTAPTTSLNALLPLHLQPFTLEKLLARILTVFEDFYHRFLQTGFSREFEELYYKNWLHTYVSNCPLRLKIPQNKADSFGLTWLLLIIPKTEIRLSRLKRKEACGRGSKASREITVC